MAGRMAGKVALVTGAASPLGIGYATARRLAQEGARVVLADIDAAGVERGAAAIRAEGGVAAHVALNVRDEAQWEAAMAALSGPLDVLVNNAGIALLRPIADCSAEEFDNLIAVNLRGVFLGTRAAVRAMRAGGQGGSIINASSVAGIVGANCMAAYAAAKGGIRMFSKSVAIETAPENIRCNSVHPGMVDTNFFHGTAEMLPDVAAAIRATIPMGRLGRADEIANVILFLASDEASYVTGAEFVADGGFTAA
jgi:NAD(P)-dependent dehydrogenase (short-subunit alcohol dehydrogenase family)